MLFIMSISWYAWNNGLNMHISKKIQPTDHISTAIEYSVAPSKSSGALYQIVTTSYVSGLSGTLNALASPKSASFN